MNILDTIVEHKRMELLLRKQKRPLSNLASFPNYRRKVNPIILPGEGKPGIIAEFKRRSPSKGALNMKSDPKEVALAYQAAGVSVMSVLTDRKFFGGSFRDLADAREACPGLPLLRKDFIIDPYQVHEASAYGADMILLIAAILGKQELADLAGEAEALGMHVLLEVHDEAELEKYVPSIGFVGVNNRDLKTFQVDTGRSLDLIGKMPEGVIPVSESGINSPGEIALLFEAGFKLFLMGERFMKQSDPGEACRSFIEKL
jgi:indole-3-glycerol phosphate synthase